MDENMQDQDKAAMVEGVRNSECVIVVVTIDIDEHEHDHLGDPFFVTELEWARQARRQIKKVLYAELDPLGFTMGRVPVLSRTVLSQSTNLVVLNHRISRYWAMDVQKIVNNTIKSPPDVARLRASNNIEGLVQVMLHPRNPAHRLWAVKALGDLARIIDNQVLIVRAGAVEPLMVLVSTGDRKEKNEADRVLSQLAGARALEDLVPLLSTGVMQRRSQAAEMLAHLSSSISTKILIVHSGAVEPLMELFSTGDEGASDYALKALCALDCSAVVQPLYQVFRSCDAKGKKLAGRMLLKMAHVGGLEPLIELLSTGDREEKRVAVDVLADLAWKTDGYKAPTICDDDIKAPMQMLLMGNVEETKEAVHQLGMWASNDTNQVLIAHHGAPVLVDLLSTTDIKLRRCVMWTLGWLASNDKNKILIVRAGALEPLVQVLSNGDTRGKQEAARVLATLATSEGIRAAIARAGAVAPLQCLMTNGGHKERRWAAVALHLME